MTSNGDLNERSNINEQRNGFDQNKQSDLEKQEIVNLLNNNEQKNPTKLLPKIKLWLKHLRPSGRVARYLYMTLAFILIYANIWGIFGKKALPKGSVFSFIIASIAAWYGGELIKKIRLPAMLGMLFVGFALGNVPYISVGQYVDPKWSSTARSTAVAVMLTRAGMDLNVEKLKQLGCVVIRLGVLSYVAEAVGTAVAAHFLFNMPWIWAFLLGTIISGPAPGMVVPIMLNIQKEGYGVEKGIPKLAGASNSFGDAFIITLFGVLFGAAFQKGSLVMTILQGPMELLEGFLYGGVIGVLLWFLPHKDAKNVGFFLFLGIFLGCTFAIIGGYAINHSGAGAFGCIILAFIANHGWRNNKEVQERVEMIYHYVWLVLQPVLFAMIGCGIKLNSFEGYTVGLSVAAILCGLTVRIIVTFLLLIGQGFNWKEKIYIQLTALPKVLIQGAFGPIIMENIIKQDLGEDIEKVGMAINVVCIIAVLMTAPFAVSAIGLLGKYLLVKSDLNNPINDEKNEDTTT